MIWKAVRDRDTKERLGRLPPFASQSQAHAGLWYLRPSPGCATPSELPLDAFMRVQFQCWSVYIRHLLVVMTIQQQCSRSGRRPGYASPDVAGLCLPERGPCHYTATLFKNIHCLGHTIFDMIDSPPLSIDLTISKILPIFFLQSSRHRAYDEMTNSQLSAAPRSFKLPVDCEGRLWVVPS